jgi:hypothetical protein
MTRPDKQPIPAAKIVLSAVPQEQLLTTMIRHLHRLDKGKPTTRGPKTIRENPVPSAQKLQ